MISMQEKQEIIIQYFREGFSQRQIAKNLGINRKTVRRYLTEYEEKASHLLTTPSTVITDDICSKPQYKSTGRQKRKLTTDILNEINALLLKNEERRHNGQHKQQYKSIDIYEHLKNSGFTVGYSTVCRWVKEIEERSKEAFIRQEYTRGDICEFDWGEVKINTSKGIEVYQMAVFTSGYSNFRYARLFKHQDTNSFQQAHVCFFEKVDGVYKTLVYDNMKVAVKKFVGPHEKEATEGLLKLSLYYNFSFRFCNVRKGNEKGKVERSVEYIRRKAFAFKENFASLEEANAYLETICDTLNEKPQKRVDGKSYYSLFQEEKPHLFPTKPPFECSESLPVRVDKYSTITYKTSHYSVPDYLVGKMVIARVYPDKISLSYDDKTLCTHIRLSGHAEWSIQLEHYTKTLKRKPGALAGSLALSQADSQLQKIYENYFQNRAKEFIELIEFCGKEGISTQKLQSIITYIKPRREDDVTLDKIKILWERKEQNEPVRNSVNEIDAICNKQLTLLSELIPESGSGALEAVEVL